MKFTLEGFEKFWKNTTKQPKTFAKFIQTILNVDQDFSHIDGTE